MCYCDTPLCCCDITAVSNTDNMLSTQTISNKNIAPIKTTKSKELKHMKVENKTNKWFFFFLFIILLRHCSFIFSFFRLFSHHTKHMFRFVMLSSKRSKTITSSIQFGIWLWPWAFCVCFQNEKCLKQNASKRPRYIFWILTIHLIPAQH